MFKFRHFTRILLGIRSIGDINTCYKFDKDSIPYAIIFPRNLSKSFHQNKDNGPSKWDFNWDQRGLKAGLEQNTNEIEENHCSFKSKFERHIILIRHGHYNKNGKTDKEKILTKLGVEQAMMTGMRLKELDIPYTCMIHSTMTRAAETAKIICSCLPDVPVKDSDLLREGIPIPTEPPLSNSYSPEKIHRDGARIEAAFREYFYRADADQENDTFTIIVCHANVIRYFVCRALQYPPEGWLRLTLRHASITWITIEGSGIVSLVSFGDAGYMPPSALTAN